MLCGLGGAEESGEVQEEEEEEEEPSARSWGLPLGPMSGDVWGLIVEPGGDRLEQLDTSGLEPGAEASSSATTPPEGGAPAPTPTFTYPWLPACIGAGASASLWYTSRYWLAATGAPWGWR